MKTLKLTAKDFKDTDSYYKEYVGTENVSNFEGHIEIEANLGYVFFTALRATGKIVALAGSGIEAGWGIKAGQGIEAGWGIKAGSGIEAGWGIKAGLSIRCKGVLKSSLRVFSGLCTWKIPTEEEKVVECKRFEAKELSYGVLKELE